MMYACNSAAITKISSQPDQALPGLFFIKRAVLTVLLLSSLIGSSVLMAQIEVIEGEPTVITDSRYPQARTYSSPPVLAKGSLAGDKNARSSVASAESSDAELFIQLQSLQVEVRELRGLVEQQGYIIEQLSQKRMDDYLDLDKRIGELTTSAMSSTQIDKNNMPTNVVSTHSDYAGSSEVVAITYSTATVPSPLDKGVGPSSAPPIAVEADIAKQAYRAAYQKVKGRQFEQARESFALFITEHPSSHYVPTAYFWLGELYYLESELLKAKQSFSALIAQYPQHRKVAEAKFKLGKVHNQLGDKDAARVMIESVLNDHPSSGVANPAREYLNNSLR